MIKTLQILKLQQQITRLEVEDFPPRSLPPKKCERSYVSLGKVKKMLVSHVLGEIDQNDDNFRENAARL